MVSEGLTIVKQRTTRLAALLGALCVFCGEGAARAELPRQVRVLSYNIHHAEGVDGKIDLERIANVVKGATPDVAAIQEVDQGTARTQRVDMPAELHRLTGLQAVFARNFEFEGGGYGTAVLTRLPIKGNELHRLPSHYPGEQRGVAAVELGAGDDTFVFLSTHLDYRPDDGERLDSVKKIGAIIEPFGDKPMILAGDLNANPDSRVLEAFERDGWQRANAEIVATFPSEAPAKQIDYILVRPANKWRTVEVRVLEEPIASDHRPVLAVLERVD
jgi:endonuclease/exonuclease/phosphatase family metal-dependent hydrolase